MEEDNESSNWVFVNDIDLAKEATSLNQSSSFTAILDSDQESDGSISVIGDHATDSYSDEELENDKVAHTPISLEPLQFSHCEEIKRTSLDDKSKLNTPQPEDPFKKQFFLNCQEEPVLEVSEVETDNCLRIVKQDISTLNKTGMIVKSISDRWKQYSGIIMGLAILLSSLLIRHYLTEPSYQDIPDNVSQNGQFLELISENEETKDIVKYCLEKHKESDPYSECVVEKCVIKKLRRKNRNEIIKRTELYLQMKERMLEIREMELAKNEKEILKIKQRMFHNKRFDKGTNNILNDEQMYKDSNDYNENNSEEKRKNKNFREVKMKYNIREKYNQIKNRVVDKIKKVHKVKGENLKNKIKILQKRETIELKNLKEEDNQGKFKNQKMNNVEIEHKLDQIKFKTLNEEQCFKKKIDFEKNNKNHVKKPNEEWYIKYNPVKNTVELINITNMPERDSQLIKNGNKTINGQWYFSLYGARSTIRNREKMGEWYFKRAAFRELKRDKARWYFNYMSARDDTRYLF